MACPNKIRPFRPVREVELECQGCDAGGAVHRAILRDFGFKGNETLISWMDSDRRNFTGTWRECKLRTGAGHPCILPYNHRGDHAA